jgi:hypothetical protein
MDWGKYYFKGDSLIIEHIKNLSSGGGCQIRKLMWNAHVSHDSLFIHQGPVKQFPYGVLQYIYPEEGIGMKYIGTFSDDILDPAKAKINR